MKNIYAFDIETTGKSKYSDEILQLSIVDSDLRKVFSEYFKPVKKTEWTEAQEINHISPAMVKDCKTIDEFKDEIINKLNSCDVLVGFNSDNFDLPFLERVLNYKVKCQTVDLMKVTREKFGRYNNSRFNPSLEDACEWLGVSNKKAHDSLADAAATMQLFLRTMQETQKPNLVDIYTFSDGNKIYSKDLADKYQETSGATVKSVQYYENGKLIDKPTDLSKYRVGNFVKGSKKDAKTQNAGETIAAKLEKYYNTEYQWVYSGETDEPYGTFYATDSDGTFDRNEFMDCLSELLDGMVPGAGAIKIITNNSMNDKIDIISCEFKDKSKVNLVIKNVSTSNFEAQYYCLDTITTDMRYTFEAAPGMTLAKEFENFYNKEWKSHFHNVSQEDINRMETWPEFDKNDIQNFGLPNFLLANCPAKFYNEPIPEGISLQDDTLLFNYKFFDGSIAKITYKKLAGYRDALKFDPAYIDSVQA